ncbi:uncharacterized protein UV8b_04140 [Ustilaginoidea virens]|uniref:Uncharacterized protein n=1 Tax=Ustilaginoidea virens TaxID=1159556 RepID=A0A8E5HQX5_USTVR|nr:uncharacterized protein UV8b_04140 [Ustilaginoidea virens]QUC19899.1 hypothetical protein UV8b_04140 [Ustilaginoidea virens]
MMLPHVLHNIWAHVRVERLWWAVRGGLALASSCDPVLALVFNLIMLSGSDPPVECLYLDCDLLNTVSPLSLIGCSGSYGSGCPLLLSCVRVMVIPGQPAQRLG